MRMLSTDFIRESFYFYFVIPAEAGIQVAHMLSSASIGSYFKFQLDWILAYARMTEIMGNA
jgi:hypothetical protein